MKSIGFRCWKDKFSYIIVEGQQDNPTTIKYDHIKMPEFETRPEKLSWFRQEVTEILDTNEFDVAIFKAIEPISRTKDPKRGELEGILQETIFSHEKPVSIEGRIKKQLNSKTNARKAKYLGELLILDAFKGLPKSKYEDACVAALSGLPKD